MLAIINNKYVYPVFAIRQSFSNININNTVGRLEIQIPLAVYKNDSSNIYSELGKFLKDKTEPELEVEINIYKGKYDSSLSVEEILNSDYYEIIHSFKTKKGFSYFELTINDGSDGEYAEYPFFSLYINSNDLI